MKLLFAVLLLLLGVGTAGAESIAELKSACIEGSGPCAWNGKEPLPKCAEDDSCGLEALPKPIVKTWPGRASACNLDGHPFDCATGIPINEVGTAWAEGVAIWNGEPQCPGECYWVYTNCVTSGKGADCQKTLYVKPDPCLAKMEAAMRAMDKVILSGKLPPTTDEGYRNLADAIAPWVEAKACWKEKP